MTEAENETGASRAEIEAALSDPAFASLRLSGAPIVVIASDPARVVYASAEAQRLFAGDMAGLTRRLLHGGEPGASRIVALSRSLLPGAAPRLERLRFFFGPVAETITVLCRRVTAPEGATLFALAVFGMRAPAQPAGDTSPVHLVTSAPEQAPPAAPAIPRPARFSWRTDGDHVFTEIAPAFAAEVGADHAAVIGRSFVDVAADFGLDPDGRLVAALAARDTWSGLDVRWPTQDPGQRAVVTLGAAPILDADDRFDGFRGFGVVHSARVAIETPVVAAPVVAAPVDVLPTQAALHEEKARIVTDSIPASTDDAPSESIVAVTDGGAPVFADDLSASSATPEPDTAAIDDGAFVLDAPDYDDEPQETLEATLDETSVATEETAPPETPVAPASAGKVVPLRPQQIARVFVEPAPRPDAPALSPGEKSAFEEIARALGAATQPAASERLNPASNKRARDLIDLVSRFGRSDETIEKLTPVAAPAPVEPAPVAATSETVATQTPPLAAPPAAVAPAPVTVVEAPVAETPAAAVAPVEPAHEDPAVRNARALIDRLPVGVVVSRFNVAIFANRTLLDLLDYPDVDAFHAAGGLDRLFEHRAPDSGATQVETREGELLPVDARVQAIDWDGEPATLVTLRRALTPPVAVEQAPAPEPAQEPQEHQEHADTARAKTLELELRQRDAEARELHAILDTATDGVAVLDADGRILSLNRSGEALFGYDQNEVTGQPFSTLVARESEDAVAQYFDGLKSGGVASVLNDGREIVGRARQGGSIPVFVTLGRLGGATPKFCAVLRDLTAWKKAERELGDARRDAERASDLKSDFLAKISHEIRTPLNAILGFAEVIMDERFGPVGNARYRDYMRDIHKSGEHVLSLVNDLLDLSKIEAGKVDLTFTSVDANAIVSECVSLMQPQAARERIILRLSLAPNLPNIVADERSLRQIVLNILSNAVKFNEPGGQVIVSTALTDVGSAVVRVKDTGVGMSDADLETALEPFRQVATSRRHDGTGLGLPLTKALVEANRASFTIKSRKNEGTLVEVVFPPTRVLAE